MMLRRGRTRMLLEAGTVVAVLLTGAWLLFRGTPAAYRERRRRRGRRNAGRALRRALHGDRGRHRDRHRRGEPDLAAQDGGGARRHAVGRGRRETAVGSGTDPREAPPQGR